MTIAVGWIRKTSDGAFRKQRVGRNGDQNDYGFGTIIAIVDVKKEYMKRLKSKLLAKYGTQCANRCGKCFDWEPLEVLAEMLRESGGEATVGGAPQIWYILAKKRR